MVIKKDGRSIRLLKGMGGLQVSGWRERTSCNRVRLLQIPFIRCVPLVTNSTTYYCFTSRLVHPVILVNHSNDPCVLPCKNDSHSRPVRRTRWVKDQSKTRITRKQSMRKLRIVRHREMEGTCWRIPDEGLKHPTEHEWRGKDNEEQVKKTNRSPWETKRFPM